MTKRFSWIAISMIALLPLAGAAPAVAATTQPEVAAISASAAKDCVAKNNPEDIAKSFIERCRKGSIHREYPGTHYSKRVGDIQKGSSKDDKKAWKLLNDKRFLK